MAPTLGREVTADLARTPAGGCGGCFSFYPGFGRMIRFENEALYDREIAFLKARPHPGGLCLLLFANVEDCSASLIKASR
jgi:hypothetical protein